MKGTGVLAALINRVFSALKTLSEAEGKHHFLH